MPEFAFSVSGAEKALEFRLTLIVAIMMGAISGAGDTRSGTSCSPNMRRKKSPAQGGPTRGRTARLGWGAN
jgi:hypothetical protein